MDNPDFNKILAKALEEQKRWQEKERIKMTCDEIAQMFYQLADMIRLADRILSKHNCNDCGVQKTCEHCPNWGEDVRYNCPLWKGKE